MDRILVTGGAGFIGSHLTDELLRAGHQVRVLDVLTEQVHGGRPPAELNRDAELLVGDVRDPETVARALRGIDAIVHLASRVGVGQSMYEIAQYTSVNSFGTAILLQALLRHPVRKLVVASSMSVYGEGAYVPTAAVDRTQADLDAGRWDPRGPGGEMLTPVATPETKPPATTSIYALTKYDQERLCLIFGLAYGVPVVALRFFNTYGPRQALSNPYTGLLAIFASRLLNGRAPLIFEDGKQCRDFVNVADVARAVRLALERTEADGHAINVGTGRHVTVKEVADRLATVLDLDIEPKISGKFRAGDVRHCFADITLARALLGFEPQVDLEAGMTELAAWLEGQSAHDRAELATRELLARGLSR